jgi:hypothetical protein
MITINQGKKMKLKNFKARWRSGAVASFQFRKRIAPLRHGFKKF